MLRDRCALRSMPHSGTIALLSTVRTWETGGWRSWSCRGRSRSSSPCSHGLCLCKWNEPCLLVGKWSTSASDPCAISLARILGFGTEEQSGSAQS